MTGSAQSPAEATEEPTPFPDIEDEPGNRANEQGEGHKIRKGGDAPPSHKRSVSGNILSRLTFLRSNSSDQVKGNVSEGSGPRSQDLGRGAMAEAAHAQAKRKRKGSLRKTVLGKGKDRKSSDIKRSPLSSADSPARPTPEQEQAPPTPRAVQELSSPVSPESPPSWPFRTLSRVSIPSIRSSIASVDPASSVASIMSPIMAPSEASTDDEELALPQLPLLRKLPSSVSSLGDSYFPLQDPMRRMLGSLPGSPLATQPQSVAGTPPDDEGWDYSETAFWGYVILVVTWIVFVVGVGSCFGVWSWAWDVGETPYAPPELEDDPTLPIVGYYPALLVLTCVMAWVWVVVAWVGMKYFRHADFKGDDG